LELEFAAAGNIRVGCGFITGVLARRPEALDQARGVDWPTHYTGRARLNAFGQKWHNREQVLEAEVHAERARYAAAAAAGDFGTAVVYTGEAIDMIHSIEPAEAILHRGGRRGRSRTGAAL
jgi:nitronate monooxygenase